MTQSFIALTDQLCQCTVRVQVPDRAGHGTGFFVAPGWILTCAHVVKAASALVTIDWQGQRYQAEIAAQRDPAYPDLALLKFTEAIPEHPCVYLGDSAAPGDGLYAFGYPDDYANGDSATFECEGPTTEPALLKFKQGQVRPGFSGAPLLNLITGKVCGLVKLTRDRSSDLGGRAVPATVILTEFETLEAQQQAYHTQHPNWVQHLPREIRTTGRSLQFDPAHGSIVNNAAPLAEVLQPYPSPVLLLPGAAVGALDRETEFETATNAIAETQPLEIYGEAGIGKTTLIRRLVHQAHLSDRFEAGMVYQVAHQTPVADLLQACFDAFYATTVPFKPSLTQIRHALKDKRALLLLDDVALPPEQVEELRHYLPSFSVLTAARDRYLLGEGCSIRLDGLPQEAAIQLVARSLHRELTEAEQPHAQAICAALAGHPHAILQLVSDGMDRGESLAAIAQHLQQSESKQAAILPILASLAEPQRFVLAVLLALGGLGLLAEQVQALTSLPEVMPILAALQQRHWIQSDGSRYRIAANLIDGLAETWDVTLWQEKALHYFTDWATQHQANPMTLQTEANTLLQLLEWAYQTERWADVLRLGRILEYPLTLNCQWGNWFDVLQWQLAAARTLEDAAAEAWVLHQLGSQALSLEDLATAQENLKEALRLRESLGDTAGAVITRHNLNLLLPPLVSLPSEPNLRPQASTPKWLVGTVATMTLIGSGFLLWRLFQPGLQPPTDLSVELLSNTAIALSWSDNNENESGFQIQSRTDGGNFQTLGQVPADITTFNQTQLIANQTYEYRVGTVEGDDIAYSNSITLLTPPRTPTLISAIATSQTAIDLTWQDPNPNAAEIKIERSSDEQTFETIKTVAAGTSTYTDQQDLAANQTYFYRLRTTNQTGDSEPSATLEVTTLPKIPAAPSSLQAEAPSSTSVTLTWQDNSDNEAGFVVERRNDGADNFERIGTPDANQTTFQDADLQPNTAYQYRVKAQNRSGTSVYSNTARIQTPIAPPTAPDNLTAETQSQTEVQLTWRDRSETETGFVLERTIGDDAFQTVAELKPDTTTYRDRSLDPETTYTYRIRATNEGGSSANSDPVSVSTWPNRPSAPADLRAIAPSESEIVLTWRDTSANESSFVIERRTGEGEFEPLARLDAEATTYRDRTASANTAYSYRIQARNQTGGSAYSNVAQIRTPALPPDPAATELRFGVSPQSTPNTPYVRITGIVTNVGAGRFESGPGQLIARLYETYGSQRNEIASRTIRTLAPNETVEISTDRPWFVPIGSVSAKALLSQVPVPPDYELVIDYVPNLQPNANPRNRDRNFENNTIRRSGTEINRLF